MELDEAAHAKDAAARAVHCGSCRTCKFSSSLSKWEYKVTFMLFLKAVLDRFQKFQNVCPTKARLHILERYSDSQGFTLALSDSLSSLSSTSARLWALCVGYGTIQGNPVI